MDTHDRGSIKFDGDLPFPAFLTAKGSSSVVLPAVMTLTGSHPSSIITRAEEGRRPFST